MQNNRFSVRVLFVLVISAIVLCCATFSAKHPYYISVTEIRFNTAKQNVNTSCRMFTDDLQQALFKLYNKRINLQQNDTAALPLLQRYISERLQINIDGHLIKFKVIGYEIEEEATWCYLEHSHYYKPGKITVNNKLLFDFLPEQTNFIHCYNDEDRKSTKLVNPNSLAVIEF
jgi:hypothetical protein